jgi:acetyl-CoA carboxylase alpha subunit
LDVRNGEIAQCSRRAQNPFPFFAAQGEDTPGVMVGPDAEKTAIVRHVARMFVTGASLTVPIFTVVLRKGYGLGAQAMAGGGFHARLHRRDGFLPWIPKISFRSR